MRIDMHVHYIPTLQHEKDQYSDEPFWRYLVEPTEGKSVQGWASLEQMVRDMDDAGIDRAVIQGEYYQAHDSAVRKNNLVLGAIKDFGNRIDAFASIQPKAGERALDELKRCLDSGMTGVGEISPYAQGFSLNDADFLQLVETCTELHIPLLMHANDEVGRFYKGKVPIPIRNYYELAEQFPELRLILAHWGGGLIFYEMVPHVRKVLRNVRYDTAASPLLYPTSSVFKSALECIEPHKILYGSDYPLLVYPKKQSNPDFTHFIDEIKNLELAREIEEAILGGNAERTLYAQEKAGKSAGVPNAWTGAKAHITDSMAVTPEDSVCLIASTFPATQDVFEKYHLEWQDTVVPPWEPIGQSAYAHGLDNAKTSVLISELNEAIKGARQK